MSVDLATLGLRVDGSGAIVTIQQFGSAAKEASSSAAGLEGAAGRLKDTFLEVAGVLGVGFGLKEISTIAAESQSTFAQLEAGVRSTGEAAGFTAPQLREMAEQMQGLSGFSHVAIEQTQSLFLLFQGLKGDQFKQATQAAEDLAARMGTDVPDAARQLGKALEDPTTGLTMLRRAGIVFTESQQDQIKAMAAMGDLMGAQGMILDLVTQKVGGSAAAYRDTLGGALSNLKNQIIDFIEVDKQSTSGIANFINEVAAGVPHIADYKAELLGVGAALATPALASGVAALVTGIANLNVVSAFSMAYFATGIPGAFAAAAEAGTGLSGVMIGLNATVLPVTVTVAAFAAVLGLGVFAVEKLFDAQNQLIDAEDRESQAKLNQFMATNKHIQSLLADATASQKAAAAAAELQAVTERQQASYAKALSTAEIKYALDQKNIDIIKQTKAVSDQDGALTGVADAQVELSIWPQISANIEKAADIKARYAAIKGVADAQEEAAILPKILDNLERAASIKATTAAIHGVADAQQEAALLPAIIDNLERARSIKAATAAIQGHADAEQDLADAIANQGVAWETYGIKLKISDVDAVALAQEKNVVDASTTHLGVVKQLAAAALVAAGLALTSAQATAQIDTQTYATHLQISAVGEVERATADYIFATSTAELANQAQILQLKQKQALVQGTDQAKAELAFILANRDGILAEAIAQQKVTDAMNDTLAPLKAQTEFIASMQTDLSSLFQGLATKGLPAFQTLFNDVKTAFLRMVGDILASDEISKLRGTLQSLLNSNSITGYSSGGGSAGGASSGMETAGVVEVVGDAVSEVAGFAIAIGAISGAIHLLTEHIQAAALANYQEADAAFKAATALGTMAESTTDQVAAIRAAALADINANNTAASKGSYASGAGLGYNNGLDIRDANTKEILAEEAAKLAALASSLTDSIAQAYNTAFGNDFANQILAARAAYDAQNANLIAALKAGLITNTQFNTLANEVYDTEKQTLANIAKAQQDAANQVADSLAATQARLDTALNTPEAAAETRAAQERAEIDQLIASNAGDAEIALTKLAQAAEDAAAAQAAATKAQEDLESLQVRDLRATGQGSAADLLALQDQQAQELQAARDAHDSVAYIALLQKTLADEMAQFLAQQNSSSATGSVGASTSTTNVTSTLTSAQGDRLLDETTTMRVLLTAIEFSVRSLRNFGQTVNTALGFQGVTTNAAFGSAVVN